MSTASPTHRAPLRSVRRRYRLFLGVSGAVLGAALVFAWTAAHQNSWGSLRVASGSMMPTLRGPAWLVTCSDCLFEFDCCRESPPRNMQATCPNCGHFPVTVDHRARRAGQPVTLEALVCTPRTLRRWDVVTFRQQGAGNEDRLGVKRIVGLPGEKIAIRDGELYNGSMWIRKSLAEFLATAILVHDDRYRPQTSAGEWAGRWRPEATNSAWRLTGDGYCATRKCLSTDWLIYHHRIVSPVPGDRRRASPVMDNYGCNQGLMRPLYAVRDVGVTLEMHADVVGTLSFRLTDGASAWIVQWHTGCGQVVLHRDRQHVHTDDIGMPQPQPAIHQVAVALCDGQIMMSINGVPCLRWTADSRSEDKTESCCPLAIRWDGGGSVQLRAVRVWRDLYYVHPQFQECSWEMDRRLGPGEYCLLGDNSPLAEDGRSNRHLERMPVRHIMGKVKGE